MLTHFSILSCGFSLIQGAVTCVAFSRAGDYFSSGGSDEQVKVYSSDFFKTRFHTIWLIEKGIRNYTELNSKILLWCINQYTIIYVFTGFGVEEQLWRMYWKQ